MKQPKILNPFALPSETESRFLLLITAVIALLLLFGALFAELAGFTSATDIESIFEMLPFALSGQLDLAVIQQLFSAEFKRKGTHLLFVIGYAATILSLCALGYRYFLPYLERHYWRIHPMDERKKSHRKMIRTINQIRDELVCKPNGISLRDVTYEIDEGKLRGEQKVNVFGSQSKPSVRLTNGMRLVHQLEPNRFRVLIQHEFAHIINHDLLRSRFSRLVWIAYLVCAIIPMLLIQGRSIILFPLNRASVAWQIALLISQSALTLWFLRRLWIQLVKAREHYADWRVAIWKNSEDVLTALVGDDANELNYHPSQKMRRSILENPNLLFRFKQGLTFDSGMLAGFLQTIGVVFIALLAQLIISGGGLLFVGMMNKVLENQNLFLLLISVLFMVAIFVLQVSIMLFLTLAPPYCISMILVPQLQRQIILNTMEGARDKQGYLYLIRYAFVTAVGLELGYIVFPGNAGMGLSSIFLAPISVLTHFLVTTLFLWCWLAYVRFTTLRTMCRSISPLSPPTVGRRIRLGLYSILLWLLLIPSSLAYPLLPTNIQNPLGELPPDVIFQIQRIWEGVVIGLVTVAIIVLPITFFLTWLVTRSNRSQSCSFCEQTIPQFHVIGDECPCCTELFGKWLFVDEVANQ